MDSLGIPGARNVVVSGSKNWLLDYYSPGPPPIAVEFLNKKTKFYEKLVKLLDIRKTMDARAIMLAARGTIDRDAVNLALNFGIYLVMKGDDQGLKAALGGGDLTEVNNSTRAILLNMKNRKLASECRSEILDLLSRECLTIREIISRLRLRFGERTVYSQLRSLRTRGDVISVCRLEDGTAVFGLPGIIYPVREDLSRSSRAAYIKNLILNFLKEKGRPITYLEIMSHFSLKRSIVTSALRDLKRKGKVIKTQGGWTLKES
ncbi:MAG: hypothetical protein H5T34_05480 [Candidatus Methanomethyliales bacterium]|nr:hypothetical protein [Candidatus Methanomethylicales archaeon]